jgi:hypothetical protein
MTLRYPLPLAGLGGLLLTAILAAVSGGGDLTDGPLFFTAGLPAGLAVCGGLAWLRPRGAWRYGIAFALAQCVGGFVAAGEPGNLWPIVILFYLALSLPMVATAVLVGFWRRSAAG